MFTWPPRVPKDSLNRTRLVAVGVGGVAMLSQVRQIGNELRSPQYGRLAAAAIVLLFAILVVTYLRGRATWWNTPLVPVLIAIGGSGLQDPLAGMALAMCSTIVLSLYGSMRLWAARVAGAMIAIVAAVAISPRSADRAMNWNSPSVINVVPQILLMALLTRGIYLALLRQEQTAKREAVLARAGLAMIGATDVGQVRETGRQIAEELVGLSPGVALLVLRRDRDGLRVANLAGAPAELRGRLVPADAAAHPTPLAAMVPGHSCWQVDSLGADPVTADVYIAVGGRRAVRPDVLDAFRNLAHQVLLAEESCRVHAELDHLAHHDHLTQLPTRAKFFRTLQSALAAAGDGSVALLNVDLDDFKQVNDGYGHHAGDELLVEVAARMVEVAAGRGLAGRFGGDEFALLLTGLTTPFEAVEIAEALSARLAAPTRLAVGTVAVGASIGIANAEPGITVAELTRRADEAMYAAKAAGKNRVATFRPTRHPAPA